MDQSIVRLKKYGTSFATRDRAKVVGRDLLGAHMSGQRSLILDYSGVRVISPSFADELMKTLGVILKANRVRGVKFIGCSDNVIETLKETFAKRNRLEPLEINPFAGGTRFEILSQIA